MTRQPTPARPSSPRRHRLAALAAVAAGSLVLTGLGTLPAHADPTVTIAQVQGTSAEQGAGGASPYVGQTVTVRGVVTGDYRTGGFSGITVQTEGSGGATDATPGASDGVFVYLRNVTTTAAIGDLVDVTGAVSEYNGLTEIAPAAGGVALVTAGVGVPAATPLADSVLGADREADESMLVAPSGLYSVISSHELYSFGDLWLAAGVTQLVSATEQAAPGAPAQAAEAANAARRILLDDGFNIRVDNSAYPGTQPYFTKDDVVRNGDSVAFPSTPYVLSYGFGDWRLEPQTPISSESDAALKPTFGNENPRPSDSPAVGGDGAIASFNVENYFTTLSSENSLARGASTAAEFQIQRAKTVTAINGLGADIVTLEEIENSIHFGLPVDSTLANLVDGLNAAAGSDVWAYVPTPAPLRDAVDTTDVITNAIIYKKDRVQPVGDSQTVVDESVWGNAREPIAQTFTAGGTTVTVIGNHFKSKGGGTGAEPADGQGFFTADRVKQAQSLASFVTSLQASSGSKKVVALGDFNSYAEEDPITTLTGSGLVDLATSKAPGQYTYSFDGEVGSLDHALATPEFVKNVAGVGVWSINAPEWSDRGYAYEAADPSTPFRTSDHNPIKIGVTIADQPVSIDVLSINDFHGRIEAGGASGGAAVLAGAVEQYRQANPNTIFASAGDNIGASTFTSFIQNDTPTLDSLNAMGLDVSTLGNHEFDQGRADVDGRVTDESDFPYVNDNLYDRSTGEPAYDEYWIKNVDGIRVAFIGAVTAELPALVSPGGISTLEVKDPTTELNRVAAELRDGDESNGESDVTIALVHEGAATPALADATNDSAFGTIATGTNADVDAIVSGHTHQLYVHDIPAAGQSARPVYQSAKYGEDFGHLAMSVDPATKRLLSLQAEVLPLNDAAGKALYPADPTVAAIVADAVAVANVKGSVKVGEITGDFLRAQQTDGSENRGGESTLGNFVADVQLAQTKDRGAEIALMNPGGLRADLTYASSGSGDPDGNVTYKEAASVQPFANTLVTEKLTGAQLKQVLEQQWQPAGTSRPFLKLGVSKGLTYAYDPAAASGSHITHVYLDGEEVADGDVHTVVVNSFLATGGDNFTTLADGADKADSGRIDLQSMVDWFQANGTATPDAATRSFGVQLSAPAAGDAYAAGEQVTATLSSLLLSGEAATDVTLSIGDQQVGTGALDPAVVDTTDEQGRAAVSFTVPSGLDGAQVLAIAVPATGATIGVPFTVTASTAPAEPVASRTVGYATPILAVSTQRVRYVAQVSAGSVEPTGTVTVYDGRTKVATITLAEGDGGRGSVRLPRLSRGIHLLTSVYGGSDAAAGSRSNVFPVIVWR